MHSHLYEVKSSVKMESRLKSGALRGSPEELHGLYESLLWKFLWLDHAMLQDCFLSQHTFSCFVLVFTIPCFVIAFCFTFDDFLFQNTRLFRLASRTHLLFSILAYPKYILPPKGRAILLEIKNMQFQKTWSNNALFEIIGLFEILSISMACHLAKLLVANLGF